MARSSALAWVVGAALVAAGNVASGAETGAREPTSQVDRDTLEALRSISYVDWTDELEPQPVSGVTRHDRRRAYDGYNLMVSRIGGGAYLMDMDGRYVHAWVYLGDPFDGERPFNQWDTAILLENGDLVVLLKFNRVVRLDWSSRVLWSTPLKAHHDVAQTERGTFFTWVKEVREYRGLTVRFPFLAELSADGDLLFAWSTYDNLDNLRASFDRRLFLDTTLDRGDSAPEPDTLYDYFHPNTVSVIGANANAHIAPFAPGNLLVCFKHINQIGILDRASLAVVWSWGAGDLEWPHHPTMLANGNILTFDNGPARKFSRVVELDPVAQTIVWEYRASGAEEFFSESRGSAQRLPNGNTLICEADAGRTFEVTPAGEIVWEHFNPELNSSGQRARLYRVIRYPRAWIDPLLRGEPSREP